MAVLSVAAPSKRGVGARPKRRLGRRAVMVASTLLGAALTIPATATSAVAGTDGCPPNGQFYGVAHQGAHDTDTYRNTMPAFRLAEARCQLVESDVRFTSDGIPVMVHDKTTSPMFNRRCDLVVAESTLAQIQDACRNPDGSTVATLNEYLSVVQRQGFVEVKPGNYSAYKIKQLIAAIYAAGDENVVSLESTETWVLDRIAALDNDAKPISRAWKGALVFYTDEVARVCDYAIYHPSKFTTETVTRLKSRGVESISANNSDPATWSRVASMGAYGGLTDASKVMFDWQNSR